jgi:hypothetical protein
MKASVVKATAHERDVGEAIKVAENPHAIDQDDVARLRSLVQSVEAKPLLGRPLFDRIEVGRRWLVRCDYESSTAESTAYEAKCREKYPLVGRPCGSSDDRWAGGGQAGEHRRGAINRVGALPDLIVACIACDNDNIAPDAELDQTLSVLGIDCAHRVEQCVGISKQGASEARTSR